MELSVVVLAAGQGTRMKSTLPKVLHPVGGKPMLQRVVDTAHKLKPQQTIVVYGHQGNVLIEAFSNQSLHFVEQIPQRGTADAVAKAAPLLDKNQRVLVLYGDVPMIAAQTLQNLLAQTPENALGLVTVEMDNPYGLGRIIRENGKIVSIVEQKDATPDQQQIREVNTGIYVINGEHLNRWLPQINNHNQQQEFYLTDIIALAVKDNVSIVSISPTEKEEISGVNDRAQLAQSERYCQQKIANELMAQGVTLLDPQRLDVRGELSCQQDVTIDINVIVKGNVSINKGCHIGPNCVLINCTLGENVTLLANSYLEDVVVGNDVIIGPFGRLRPGSQLQDRVHIGNFVEVKNSIIGQGSKINHLSYIGDAVVGKDVNIGAGTITCNYDGVNKHQTIIEDNVMVGSDTQLIAPVRVGKGATIGAGSTVSKNVPEEQLTLTHQLNQRSKQWDRPKKANPNNQQEKA